MNQQRPHYYSIPIADLLSMLKVDPEIGLSERMVEERRGRYGANHIIAEKQTSSFIVLLEQFTNSMMYLLFGAMGLSFWFEEYFDALAILLVVLINGLIGFWMEVKARHSIEALKKMVNVTAKVYRNEVLVEIPSDQIVPGDILYVEAGDMITADARIVNAVELSVNESSLTGEALTVKKRALSLPEATDLTDRENMLYKGTYVASGNAKAIVVATGMQTELGQIANITQLAEQNATPLEKKLQVFTRKIIRLMIVLVLLIFLVGMFMSANYFELIEIAIALAVAAIPEGLPIVATLALAMGMLKMAKKNVVVKKLSSVETLGGTTVICTDKTGTLTKNEIEVSEIITADETSEKNIDLMQRIAILCNNASITISGRNTKDVGDPLETGLLKYTRNQGVVIEQIKQLFPRVGEVPFSSETKMMATLHMHGEEYWVFAKGAVDELLLRCTSIISGEGIEVFDKTQREHFLQLSEQLARRGMRLIAGAYKTSRVENIVMIDDLVFAGIYVMTDPPAEGVKETIEECHVAGIKVVMITGDHPATASYIASKLGIAKTGHQVMKGKEMLPYEQLTKEDKRRWLSTRVFARVSPLQKLDIVKVFQENNDVTAMTGDGVNDAPALKKADIGIAMGKRGTQVAQEAADMVLQDDSFSSIVYAVKQGRTIFGNIQKFIIYLLSCNLSELLVISFAALSNSHFHLFPLQILFINLITDVLPALALGFTKSGPLIMEQPPYDTSAPIISNRQWSQVWMYAGVISVCTLTAVYFSHYFVHTGTRFNPALCNNILFFSIILCQLLHVLNMASSKLSFFKNEVFKNKFVWYALLICVSILSAVIFIPSARGGLHIYDLQKEDWLIIVSTGIISLMSIQLMKKLKLVRDE